MTDEHGTAQAYRKGCRCVQCIAGNTARARQYRAQCAARPREEVPHGTIGGYVNWSCRCTLCRIANADSNRRLRERLAVRTDVPHGTYSGYIAWACRCPKCCAAHTAYVRARRQRKAAS
jgi:hypothetical protein